MTVAARHCRSLLAAACFVVGCTDTQKTGPSADVTGLVITPDSVTTMAGEEVQFHATGSMADGSTQAVAVTWSATGGTIDRDGRFIASTIPGDFRATATLDVPRLEAHARIHNRGALQRVVLVPESATVAPGAHLWFTASARAADGASVPARVTYAATGGSIDTNGVYLAGQASGDFQVIAAAPGGTLADTSRVTVAVGAPTLARVSLVPSSVTLADGATTQFAAYGTLSNGDSIALGVSFDATGGTITAGGLYTAGPTAGDFRVIATEQGGTLADTAAVTVVLGTPVLARVVLVPSAVTLDAGATQRFAAYGTLSNGDSVAVSVSFSATGGTITTSGLYTAGQTPGDFRVVAAEPGGTLADTASVHVTTPGSAVVLVGAGDIADCGSDGDEATAALLDGIPGTVFTAGDNAYSNGSATDYSGCYEPSWGRHKARTRPAPGNHDYNTAGAAAYFAYFGDAAGPPGRGYYSYDLGAWHIVSLNSEVDMSAGSAQETWLRADLAANPKQCTLAYWHKPRFSSGTKHGSDSETQPLWQALYDYGAEIAIAGHDHDYERFAPQTPSGTADPARGIREFVVGTGGSSHSGVGTPLPTSEASDGATFGVLKLTLGSGTYSWQFVPVAGGSFTDSGSGTCH